MIAVVVGILAASSVHIVMEWERAVVMRFGRFNRVAGPGLVFTWPVIEFYTVRIDQRVAGHLLRQPRRRSPPTWCP